MEAIPATSCTSTCGESMLGVYTMFPVFVWVVCIHMFQWVLACSQSSGMYTYVPMGAGMFPV